MTRKSDSGTSVTIVALSAEVQGELIALSDGGEVAWKRVADIYARLQSEMDAPRMALYQAIGLYCRQKASTVRSWVGMRKALNGLDDEYVCFGLSHWRIIRSASKRTKKPIEDIALECALDDVMSPETLAAKLNGEMEKPDPFARALLRAQQAMATALRHARNDKARQAGMRVLKAIERMEQ